MFLLKNVRQLIKTRQLSLTAVKWNKKIVKTPSMGESITEGTLTQWFKKVGDSVKRDEQVATIETDKVNKMTQTRLMFKLILQNQGKY
jgi:hypothetical protein